MTFSGLEREAFLEARTCGVAQLLLSRVLQTPGLHLYLDASQVGGRIISTWKFGMRSGILQSRCSEIASARVQLASVQLPSRLWVKCAS